MTADLLAVLDGLRGALYSADWSYKCWTCDSCGEQASGTGGIKHKAGCCVGAAEAAIAAHKEAHRDGAADACPCFAEAWRRAWAVIEARHKALVEAQEAES